MMIDLVSPDFWPIIPLVPHWGISHFIWRFMDPHGLVRSSLTGCSSRRGHDRYLTEPLRSTQPGPHFTTLGFHHASPPGRYILDMCAWFSYGFGRPLLHVRWQMISCRSISDLSCIRCPYWGIFSVSDEIYGLSWRSHVRWWMISWHLFFGPVTHLMPYWGIFRFGGSLWIFAEVTCSRIDDSMLSDLRLIIHFDAI